MYRRPEKSRFLLALVLAVAVIVPVGTGVAARMTRASVPARLVGTWQKTVTAATWQKNQVYVEPAGHWAIVITKGGVTSIFTPPGKPDSYPALTTMHVAATGTSVVFGPTADHYCSNKASYTWKTSGRALAFKVVKDDCAPRQVLLTAGAWRRK